MGRTQERQNGEHRNLKGFHTAVTREGMKKANTVDIHQHENEKLEDYLKDFSTYPTMLVRQQRVLSRGGYAISFTD